MTADSAAAEGMPEHRVRRDRRRSSLSGFLYGCVKGRRYGPRRQTDNKECYVDRYDRRLMYPVLGIMLLSCADAFLTLILLNRGADEANIFMANALEQGTQHFVIVKLTLTSASLLVCAVHANFRVFKLIRVEQLLVALLGIYALLIGYELMLLLVR